MDLLWFTFSKILVHGFMDNGMGHDGAHLLTSLAARKQTQKGIKDNKYPPKLHSKWPTPSTSPYLLVSPTSKHHWLEPLEFNHFSAPPLNIIPTYKPVGDISNPNHSSICHVKPRDGTPSDLCKGLSVQRLLKVSPQGNNIRTTQELLKIQVQGLDSHPCIRNL